MPHIRRFGFSGVFVVAIIVVMLFGINPITVLTGQVAEPLPHTTLSALEAIAADEAGPEELVGAVQREADGFWDRAFRQASVRYLPVELKMVPDSAALGCGMAGSSLGVFYCPGEAMIYVDMANYAALVDAFPVEGHKAVGYLIARAFGHHVQAALRIWQDGADEPVAPADQRQQEMQAACYGGVWAKAAGLEKLFDDPAIVRAIQSRDVGADVTVAPSSVGAIVPETFTKPAVADLKRGFDLGYAIPAAGSCRLDKIGKPG